MKIFKKLLNTFILSVICAVNLVPVYNLALAQNPHDAVLSNTVKNDSSLGSAINWWDVVNGEKWALTQNPYDAVLSNTVKNGSSLGSAINWWDVVNGEKWANLFNEQVNRIIGYAVNVFIVIWIAIAFIGGYKIMTSDKEDSMKDGIKLVGFGILWIIIMVSAKFLATSLVWSEGIITNEFSNPGNNYTPNWILFADNLYNKIMYPFIKIVLYLVIWVLFFVMAGKVIWFIMSTDDVAKKKAWWIIIWSVVWILIIMWSKQIVEAVMWNQADVLEKNATWISWWENEWMWWQLLEFQSVPLIAQIINWVMWLTMFAILVLIIIQWYQIFTKPDDPKVRENLKKTILYIVIWVLVIGAAYVISNVLVVNNVPIDTA